MSREVEGGWLLFFGSHGEQGWRKRVREATFRHAESSVGGISS